MRAGRRSRTRTAFRTRGLATAMIQGSLEDKTRRSIAYLLIALLALLVIALLAMVVFGVITVGELKEFDLFLAPLVALVTGATAYYFTRKRT